mgnify:CR=1 FL=1
MSGSIDNMRSVLKVEGVAFETELLQGGHRREDLELLLAAQRVERKVQHTQLLAVLEATAFAHGEKRP